MDKMLKYMNKFSQRYNSAMNSDEELNKHSDDLIKDISVFAEKFPLEKFPLMMLSTLICKSRNQTEHIKILNRMIELGDDNAKETLANCTKQPCNECTVWDDYKSNLSLRSESLS